MRIARLGIIKVPSTDREIETVINGMLFGGSSAVASDFTEVESTVGTSIGKRLHNVVEIAIIINNMLFRGSSAMASDLAELTNVNSAVRVGTSRGWLSDVGEFHILDASGVVGSVIMVGGIPGLFKELLIFSFGL